MKLPKQWKDWCRAARLKPMGNRQTKRSLNGKYNLQWYYLVGRGRVWRVNCHWQLQCGDTYADFDRWALCDINEAPLPNNKANFVSTVKSLVALHNSNVN